MKVTDEIDWCRSFCEQHPRRRGMDISNRAIEETAAGIIRSCQTGKKPA